MNALGPLIELGIDFVPVPGVKAAFDILNFIWQNVEKASNNRDALRNLAVSAADILTAVNHVLEENEPNKHAQEMLRKMETVLTDIGSFAAEHANMNLFKLLLRNIDVEGKVEFFQNRLQNLWVAFNIVALGDIASEVHQIRQGRMAVRLSAPPVQGASVRPDGYGGGPTLAERDSTGTSHIPTLAMLTAPPSHIHQQLHNRYIEPALVDVSSSTPYQLEVRNGVPNLSSLYHYDEPFDHWGLNIPGVHTSNNMNGFNIFDARESKSWTWALVGKVITVSRNEQDHPQWKASMDLALPDGGTAAYWFSWLELYASSHPSIQDLQKPPTSAVTLRKKNSHTLIRRSMNTIDYKRPTHDAWMTILTGHAQSARDHTSQLTYISTRRDGRLPFCRVYRSADTVVHERFARADSLEPTFSRRYRFHDEDEAQTWYSIWKDCAMTQASGEEDEPVEVALLTKYGCEIKFKNDGPVLTLDSWGELHLRDWGAPRFRDTDTMVATDFKWNNDAPKRIIVDAIINSRPDWFATLQIDFPTAQSASAWFACLTGHDTSMRQAAAQSLTFPHAEKVTITHERVCWMQKIGDFIQTREATSEGWIAIFGKSYKNLEEHVSHMSVIGTSVLPFIRVWRNGYTLYLERKRSATNPDGSVFSQYEFDSEITAQTWHNIWRRHFERVVGGR